MPLPRLQLFEFNDAPWAPAALRETLVDALSRAIRWGHLTDGLVEPLVSTLRRAGTRQVLDLCAGAGGPAVALSEALAASGHDVHFLMSDLYPQVAAWEAARRTFPSRLAYVAAPVDATRVPEALVGERVPVIINALHHFKPALAREVLHGACARAPAVFIGETLTRNPLSFAAMGGVGLASLYSSPWLAEDKRLARAALTWLSPIALAASVWDGTVSALRTYEASELLAFVAELPGWEWRWGQFAHSSGLGVGNWFAGHRTGS